MDFLTLKDGLNQYINMGKSTKKIDLYGCLPYIELEFVAAWREWNEYRSQRHKPYKTQMAITKQLNVFRDNHLTLSQALECIEYAISSEWLKVFPLKFYKDGTSSRTAIGDSISATEQAFTNLQRNIDQAMRPTGTADWGY